MHALNINSINKLHRNILNYTSFKYEIVININLLSLKNPGGVQYIDSQNVEKNADKLEMPNSKRRRAVCR